MACAGHRQGHECLVSPRGVARTKVAARASAGRGGQGDYWNGGEGEYRERPVEHLVEVVAVVAKASLESRGGLGDCLKWRPEPVEMVGAGHLEGHECLTSDRCSE